MTKLKLPFKLENSLERKIARDPEWLEGVNWGKSRDGHPEGKVMLHIKEVLDNINKLNIEFETILDLRIIALIHDSFKYKVDITQPRSESNHHGFLARKFAEKYILKEELLDIIEFHDEAYHAFTKGKRYNDWKKAEMLAEQLLKRINNIHLYLLFYKCDNATGNKTQDSYLWFEEFVKRIN